MRHFVRTIATLSGTWRAEQGRSKVCPFAKRNGETASGAVDILHLLLSCKRYLDKKQMKRVEFK